MKYLDLLAQLHELELEIQEIQAEGTVLLDARIDSSTPGGGASRGNPSVQYRLRMKGQKARYLKQNEVAAFRAAILRGRRLRKLEQQRQLVEDQLDRIVAQAEKMGLILPEE